MKKWIGIWLVLLLAGCSGKKGEPTKEEWQLLNERVGGRLIQVQSPLKTDTPERAKLLEELRDPFVIEEYPWGTQSTGWLNAWAAADSAYAVAAENVSDLVEAVKFAKKHQVRLVIKGTGHDYLGRSNAPDSLLVWTHHMRGITVHDAFKPQGVSSGEGVPAVTIEAGARWGEVYQEVTTKHNRYVQGGGCASVGAVGGFLQGGGFGSFSKKYGLAAGSLLEAEVVVASGEVLIANAYQNADLFWALKGGGGGTFGIVSKATLETHELPTYFGFLHGTIKANTEVAFQALLEYFIDFYHDYLSNEHWGEQLLVKPDNSLELSLLFQGLNKEEAEAIWKPFFDWIDQKTDLYSRTTRFILLPANKFWDYDYLSEHFPNSITSYPSEKGLFYWSSNQDEVLAYWYAMKSFWLPRALFEREFSKAFAIILFQASRHWELELHFNKGLANASVDAIKRAQDTSINPDVLDAPALLIIAADAQYVFPGMKGHQPGEKQGLEQMKKVEAAREWMMMISPNTATYSNEADYFQKNWQADFWGEHYPRLLQIKRKYDPDGLFKGHHCVGSD